jgi:hypothetical protein
MNGEMTNTADKLSFVYLQKIQMTENVSIMNQKRRNLILIFPSKPVLEFRYPGFAYKNSFRN